MVKPALWSNSLAKMVEREKDMKLEANNQSAEGSTNDVKTHQQRIKNCRVCNVTNVTFYTTTSMGTLSVCVLSLSLSPSPSLSFPVTHTHTAAVRMTHIYARACAGLGPVCDQELENGCGCRPPGGTHIGHSAAASAR